MNLRSENSFKLIILVLAQNDLTPGLDRILKPKEQRILRPSALLTCGHGIKKWGNIFPEFAAGVKPPDNECEVAG